MDDYTLSDELFARHIVNAGDPVPDYGWPYEPHDSVEPKFDSVAAAIMHTWSLDSTQDEDCGDAQFGNGWHALFRSERAILHTGNSGFVSAWRIEDGKDIDAAWEKIEAGARYEDDPECEGHYDDDDALTSGAGIGELTYCDGTCVQGEQLAEES
jgi:hypothetical protein